MQGELDAYSAPALEVALDDEVASAGPPIVIDLAGVSFVASGCLGVLASASARARQAGRAIHLACPTERVARILQLTRLDDLLPAFGTVEDALRTQNNS